MKYDLILKGKYYLISATLIILSVSCSSRQAFVKRKYESGYFIEFFRNNTYMPVLNETPKKINPVSKHDDEQNKNEDLALNSKSISEIGNSQNYRVELKSYNNGLIRINSHLSKQSNFQYQPTDEPIIPHKKYEKQIYRRMLNRGWTKWWKSHWVGVCLILLIIVVLIIDIIFPVNFI